MAHKPLLLRDIPHYAGDFQLVGRRKEKLVSLSLPTPANLSQYGAVFAQTHEAGEPLAESLANQALYHR